MVHKQKHPWFFFNLLALAATLVAAAIFAWLVGTDSGKELLFRAGVIDAEPMSGLE